MTSLIIYRSKFIRIMIIPVDESIANAKVYARLACL